MSTIRELIRSRRTIFDFEPGALSADVVRDLVEAGTWAPNHKLTEPWRFILVGARTGLALAERYAEIQKSRGKDMSPEAQALRAEEGRRKFLAKPSVLCIACVQEGDEQQKREDYAATCCAAQNVQLAAWDAGIGMQWSTGPLTRDPAACALLGIDPARELIIGFFYMGRIAGVPRTHRKPVADVFRETT
jgi:nitroreductase